MNIKKITISNDPNIYEAWPDIAMTSSGKMICVFSECVHHCNREYSAIALSTSFDRGETWNPKQILVSSSLQQGGFYNNARIQELNDGRLLVVVDKIMGSNENQDESIICFFFSDDDGQKWSEEIQKTMRGIVPDRIAELKNGRWLLACHQFDQEIKNLAQRLWYSDDKGENWEGPVSVGKQSGLNLCEASIIEVDDKVVAFMRENSGQGYDCFKVISSDNGESWSEPIRFPLPGCHRPVAGFLKNGNILLTYRFMQGGNGKWGKCQNLMGALTDKEAVLAPARDKSSVRIFPIDYDNSQKPDTGYSGWVELDSNNVYVVNYLVGNQEKAYIRGNLLNLEQ